MKQVEQIHDILIARNGPTNQKMWGYQVETSTYQKTEGKEQIKLVDAIKKVIW